MLLTWPPSNTPTQGRLLFPALPRTALKGAAEASPSSRGPLLSPHALEDLAAPQVGGAHEHISADPHTPVSSWLQGLERRPRPKGTNEALRKPTPPRPPKATQGAPFGLNAKTQRPPSPLVPRLCCRRTLSPVPHVGGSGEAGDLPCVPTAKNWGPWDTSMT